MSERQKIQDKLSILNKSKKSFVEENTRQKNLVLQELQRLESGIDIPCQIEKLIENLPKIEEPFLFIDFHGLRIKVKVTYLETIPVEFCDLTESELFLIMDHPPEKWNNGREAFDQRFFKKHIYKIVEKVEEDYEWVKKICSQVDRILSLSKKAHMNPYILNKLREFEVLKTNV
jgi:hypothetical protein